MNKSVLTILIIGAVLVIGIAGAFYMSSRSNEAPAATSAPTPNSPASQTPTEQVVTYTDEGYSPQELKILENSTVVFRNQSSGMMWTASAMHPTHEVYPGTSIKKCGTAEAAGIFEACRSYGPGESWSFRFTETGTWGYHNHMKAANFGKIIVE